MKRKFRLTRSSDVKRVRRTGKTYAHPLIVLVIAPAETAQVHIGVAAGKPVGGAVQRNLAKRLIRAALQAVLSRIQPGWDLVFLARSAINGATYPEVQAAILLLLDRAGCLIHMDVHEH